MYELVESNPEALLCCFAKDASIYRVTEEFFVSIPFKSSDSIMRLCVTPFQIHCVSVTLRERHSLAE